jgi:hypothetical protein
MSKCSFQKGLRDFLTVVDANFSTPSRETTTNGSGSLNRFRFGSPLALRTGGGGGQTNGRLSTEEWTIRTDKRHSLVILTLLRKISELLLENER